MEKEFNTEGVCHAKLHYMADISAKFKVILRLTERGKYFTINRPRQYGKTTMLFHLAHVLNQEDDYVVFCISFEGVGDDVFERESAFAPMFFRRLSQYIQHSDQALSDQIKATATHLNTMEALSSAITDLVVQLGRKVVLLIDEVDKSSNNQLFVSFLGLLRDKYLIRHITPTFHSVILTGVHDVKTLKLRIRTGKEQKYNSPWNIAADFKVDMNFQAKEIQPMLEEYARDKAVVVDAPAVAERLFYYTSGHPFLVSKLCKIFDEELLPEQVEKTWTKAAVDIAANKLIGETNPNFDELSKNLDNNQDLYQLTQAIAVEGQHFPFEPHDPVANLGILYGIFADKNGLVVHNRIYQQIIVNKMIFRIQRENTQLLNRYSTPYTLPGNRLDLKKVLLKFQELLKGEYNKKERDFLERQGRLIFLAFLKPILNSHGHAFKEPQISEEKRLDILISYYQHQYVIELKIWRGEQAHKTGLDQLADYLDRLGLTEGSLLIFDHSGVKAWKVEELEHLGKKIVAVWV